MQEGGFLGLFDYHVLPAAVGGAIFLAYLLPRLVFLPAASSAALLMILGLVAFAVVP